MPRKRGKDGICPYSPSCFDCPKEDCVAGAAKRYNEILDKELYDVLLNGKKQKKEGKR